MNDVPDACKLLHGPYRPPPHLLPGDEIFCELRGFVIVADYSDAPIPWPRARKAGMRNIRKGNGRATGPLILCGDLVRAVRCESGLALQYWWGISETRTTRWRRQLDVHSTEGTRRLQRDAALVHLVANRSDTYRARTFSAAAGEKRAASISRNHPRARPWTPAEDALLGTLPDTALARQLKRALSSIGMRRRQLGIPTAGVSGWSRRAASLFCVDAQKLHSLRMERGLNLAQFSRLANVDLKLCSLVDRGKQPRISPAIAQRFAIALHCSPDEFALPHP